MIDHLLTFENADAALAALGAFDAPVILNVDGPNDQSIRIVLADAVWDRTDPDPTHWIITTPEVLQPGWHCIVVRPALDPVLRDLPGNACRLITDRHAANHGEDQETFILYAAPDLDPALLATARVEPTPLGARYPFGPDA